MLTGEFIERSVWLEFKLFAVLVKRLHTQRSGLLDDQLHYLLEPSMDIPTAPYLKHRNSWLHRNTHHMKHMGIQLSIYHIDITIEKH